MITKELLQKFCSTNETRAVLMHPSSQGDFTIACNGDVIVWVARMADVPEVEKYPNVESTMQWYKESGEWKPMPELPHYKPAGDCKECNGTGEVRCDKCLHICVCNSCEGDGSVCELVRVQIGANDFNAEYLGCIAKLPGVILNFSAKYKEPLSFKFDGGKGLLMPMVK